MTRFGSKMFFLLLFIPFLGFSQENSITVLIDTVYLCDGKTDFDIQYSYSSLYGYTLFKKSTNKKIKANTNGFITFSGNVEINSDTIVIQIPIDNDNGFLEISNLSSFKGDTIKISKLKLFESDIRDTTYTIIKYFKVQNDSIAQRAYKIKKLKKIEKLKKRDLSIPKHLELEVNGKLYAVAILKYKFIEDEISVFNGQKPVNSKSPRIKFVGRSSKTNWKYIGYIKL
ncbi:MAG: hypothetical protein WCP69_06350 [Bacteroidota bacterium]